MIRSIFILTIVVLLNSLPAKAQRAGGKRPPPSVFVTKVIEHPFSLHIEALGTLEPNERVELTLNAADRITALFFEDGQRVDKGKTLLSLAQREQVALVQAAEATTEEAKQQFERIQRLAEKEAVSASELDQARRNLSNASAQLRAVQSRQKDRVLVAPFSGVLGFRQVSVGSYIRPGDVVTTLIDDSKMKLEFTVPSTFLRSLNVGLKIDAATDDLPGEIFTGELTSLDNSIDPVSRSIRARATIENTDLILKAGMFMQVSLYANNRTSLAIPQEAIVSIGPDSFVFIINADGNAERKQIQIGTRDFRYVEIISGLDLGETVITEGLTRVRNGSAVQIAQQSTLSSALSTPKTLED